MVNIENGSLSLNIIVQYENIRNGLEKEVFLIPRGDEIL